MARQARVGHVLAVLALAWGVGLFGAALWLPASPGVGQSCSTTASGEMRCRTFDLPGQTLVEQEGVRAFVLVSPPTLASVVVLAMLGAHMRGRLWARSSVWTVIMLLWASVFVTGFSIGLGMLPAAVLLLAAAGVTEQRSRPVRSETRPRQPW